MRSLILSIATRYLLPLLMLLSIYLLLRGHNAPGGGFVGGIVASSAFALYMMAHGVNNARLVLRARPIIILSWGLFMAALSSVIPLLAGLPFMTGMWSHFQLPVAGSIGTPLLFDMGVYLVVFGVVLTIIFSAAEG